MVAQDALDLRSLSLGVGIEQFLGESPSLASPRQPLAGNFLDKDCGYDGVNASAIVLQGFHAETLGQAPSHLEEKMHSLDL